MICIDNIDPIVLTCDNPQKCKRVYIHSGEWMYNPFPWGGGAVPILRLDWKEFYGMVTGEKHDSRHRGSEIVFQRLTGRGIHSGLQDRSG